LGQHPPCSFARDRCYHGVEAQQHVLDLELSHGGPTLHYVDDNYDTGPIIAHHPVPVHYESNTEGLPADTAETLFEAVQVTEKSHLPTDLDRLLHG